MAGRPGRRARLAAAAQAASGEPPRPPRQPVELPPKPAEDAPEAEKQAWTAEVRRILRAELRELNRPARETALRAGRAKPRNRAEMEIFAKDLLGERDALIAGPERTQQERQAKQGELTTRPDPVPAIEQAGGTATPEEVGRWMAERVQQDGRLSQRTAAREIAERFGSRFTYLNDNGHPAIDKAVLAAFRASGTAFWVARARYWRPRTEDDGPGRMGE